MKNSQDLNENEVTVDSQTPMIQTEPRRSTKLKDYMTINDLNQPKKEENQKPINQENSSLEYFTIDYWKV